MEDVRTVSRRREYDLFSVGRRVPRVPTKLMARSRASARTFGKSDAIDAAAIARAALREPDLPIAELDAGSRTLRLLTDRREALVDQRRAVAVRAQWRLHELEPTLAVTAVSFNFATHRDPLIDRLTTSPVSSQNSPKTSCARSPRSPPQSTR